MKSEFTGRIVEWNEARGYGFLEANRKRVFLHINEFSERHKRPAVGDSIRFELGTDAKGRGCAKRAAHVRDGGRFTVTHLLALIGLLVLPAVAAQRLPLHPVLFWGFVIVLTAFTYAMYAHDKQLARAGAWRLPEAALHLFELLGGWPGAFIAQRRLRHKCAKTSFKFVFWLIVLLHQFVALDSLMDWKLSRAIGERVRSEGAGSFERP